MTINKDQVLRKNLTAVAIYNALFFEHKNKQKALISITIGDEKLTSLFQLRRDFISEIRKILKRKAYQGQKIAYFTNIELGASNGELTKEFNPHIHFQFFYDNYEPIKLALQTIEEKYTFSNKDIQHAKKKKAYMGYIIKEYLPKNYHATLEIQKKKLGMKKPLYTSSRKAIPNYVIRYIYHHYKTVAFKKWQTIDTQKRYQFILNQIKIGRIKIEPLLNDIPKKGYKVVKKYQVYIKIQH